MKVFLFGLTLLSSLTASANFNVVCIGANGDSYLKISSSQILDVRELYSSSPYVVVIMQDQSLVYLPKINCLVEEVRDGQIPKLQSLIKK